MMEQYNSTFPTMPSPPFWLVNQVGISQRIRFIYWVLNQAFALAVHSAWNGVPQDCHMAAPVYSSAVNWNVTSSERQRAL